ncbi:MAG: ATP-binding protein [Smithella sp.]|jgi:signal transduction histidine kinase
MMNTFILAATSFTIAVSLMIKGRRDNLQASFAGLCAAIFVSQAAITLGNIFHYEFFVKMQYLGGLAMASSALWFFRYLTRDEAIISRKLFIIFTLTSLCGAVFVFMPLSKAVYFNAVITAYMLSALVICYMALMWHVRNLSPGTEKRRLVYLLFACPIALILGNIDLLNYWGLNFPVINGIVLSVLLYLILLIIAYPQLNELHDFLARALVIFISTGTGAVIFYFASLFFSGRPPSVPGLLLTSFLVVISLSPMKMILKKIFSYFYPESKDVFTSLYEFDEKLEKEKALMLAEMAPIFAHEIRNPLGSIKGAAQYLQSEASGKEQKELLNVIVEGTDRLNAVVSQFLDYARPYKLNLKYQNINMVIQKAASIVAANKQVKQIVIVQELENNLPDAEVDEQQLMQVVLNIALNAVESMPGGGTLTFRTSSGKFDFKRFITVKISDTGTGINKKDLKNIFKPFYTTKERGVGLGLAICQKIIKEHGGSISVTSVPARDTEFIIRLRTAE